MAVIIGSDSQGKPVFNKVLVSSEEIKKANALDKKLALLASEIEEKWKKEKRKAGKSKISIDTVIEISKALAEVVDDEAIVEPNERIWVWKAMRKRHLQKDTFGMREKSRDDLEYLYQMNSYPVVFLRLLSWDSCKRLLDSPSIRQDRRFQKWLAKKTAKLSEISRQFIRRLLREIFASVHKKETSVLTDSELFAFYDEAWLKAENK